jgi:hypothetical protein
MGGHRRLRRLAVFVVVVALTSLGLVAPSAAKPKPVIDVDTVAGLYAAAPMTDVVISLAPRVYALNSGRLILGDGTELVSTLELELDADGVPTGNEVTAGAVIDTSALSTPSPIDVGAVVLGRGGRVSHLTVRNSVGFVIGIDMPFGGSVHHVISEGSFQGARMFAGAQDVRGSISQSVMRGYSLAGVAVIQSNQLNGMNVSNATIRANLDHNLITDVSAFGFAGVFVLAALSSLQGTTPLWKRLRPNRRWGIQRGDVDVKRRR